MATRRTGPAEKPKNSVRRSTDTAPAPVEQTDDPGKTSSSTPARDATAAELKAYAATLDVEVSGAKAAVLATLVTSTGQTDAEVHASAVALAEA